MPLAFFLNIVSVFFIAEDPREDVPFNCTLGGGVNKARGFSGLFCTTRFSDVVQRTLNRGLLI